MTNRKLSPPKYRFEKLMISLFFIFISATKLFAQDPTTSITPNDTTICASVSSLYINFASASNDSAVKWTSYRSSFFSTILNDTTTYYPSASAISAGTDTLYLIAYPFYSQSTHIDTSRLIVRLTSPPIVNDIANLTACSNYILPAIEGTNLSGGQAYYTATGAGGIKYLAGATISSTITLFIHDSIGTCHDEENFTITIATPPTVNDIADQTACTSYTLPAITGTNLSGGEAFYTLSGARGTKLVAGQTVSNTTTLFIHDSIGSCHDEESFIITIVTPPTVYDIVNPTACNSYILPAIDGLNLSGGQAYYSATGAGGTKYLAGATISSTTTLFIHDSIGTCHDEENFTITIVTPPNVNDIPNVTACNTYTLPTITGTNLSVGKAYYTATGATGTKYLEGQIISSSMTLFIHDSIGSCHDEENFAITIVPSPNITYPGDAASCNNYILPGINGVNLSGGQAYYTGPGATGTKYLAGTTISSTTLLYMYDSVGTCYDQESFNITITNTPAINDIADQSVCNSYTLPVITGTNLTGNEAYYTASGGLGVRRVAGETITSSTTLYIYDINGSCSGEQSFNITITNTPVVNDISDTVVCNSFTLPAINGTYLTGNQAYYTGSGGVGTRFISGQVITTSQTLYIYDANGSCSDQEQFSIIVNYTPILNNPGNQTVCNSYTLPTIGGINLSGNQAYYSGSGGSGTRYIAGEVIPSTRTLYIYDTNGSCSDQENFTINVIPTPNITSPGNQSVCDSYTLPVLTGTNLSGGQAYYTASGAGGTKYNAGVSINSTTTLYVYDSVGSCFDQKSFIITITRTPAINDIADQSVCNSYTLPTITGTNLSGNEAYYTLPGGLGVRRVAGAVISSSTTLYIYDTNGSCSTEQSFSITVTLTPVVNDIANTTACDSYTLPGIDGTNLTGNQAFYTASGGVGTRFNSGQIISSTRTLYIYDSNGNCSSEEQFTITINATPIITNPGNQTVCDAYTLPPIIGTNMSGGQAYYTAPGGGGTRYNAGVTLTNTVLLYIYDSNGSCSDQEQFTINITRSPNIVDLADQTACNSYVLPAISGTNLSGAQAYYTASAGGGVRRYDGDVINTSTFLYIYDSNGSCSDEENFMVTILPPPIINNPGNQTACGFYTLPVIDGTNLSGNQAYYTATNGGGTRYNAGSNINISRILYIYDSNGSCSDQESFNITIIPEPTRSAGANTSLCGITPYTLNGSASGHDPTSISWERISGSGSFTSATNILNPTYTPVAADYLNPVRLRLTVGGLAPCGGVYTSDVILTYSENVIVDAGPATALICEGQTYTASPSTNTPSTYQWTTNGDGNFDDDNILNTTYTPGIADIANEFVTLTLEATGSGTCSGNSIDNIILQIKRLPTVDAGPAAVNICETGTYTTTAASALNYDNLAWTVINGTGTIANATNLTAAQYIPSQADITQGYAILRLRVTSTDPCYTTAIDDIRINITNNPEITVGTIPTLCQGVPYLVTIADTAYSSSVLWTVVNGSGILTGATTINPTYTPNAIDVTSGSIVLRLEAFAISPCAGSITQSITFPVAGPPTVELGSNITVCEGTSSIALNPTVTNGLSYSWTTAGSGVFSPSRFIRNPSYVPLGGDFAAGTIKLTLVVTGQATCSSTVTDSLNIIFTAAPTAFVKSADSICVGSSYYISTAVATNYSSIVWSHDGNGTLAGANLEKPTYTSVALDAGRNVTLTMRVNGNGTCSYVEDQIVLSVLRGPTVNTGSDVYVCGTSYQISGVTTNYQDGLQWTTSGNGTFNNPTILNPIYTFGSNEIASGIVSLTLTASAISPCAVDASDSFIIHLVDGPIAYAGPDISICQTQNYVTSSATASNSTSVLWEIVSGSGTIANANNLVTTYTPSTNDINLGTVTLRLTAYGNVSCPSHSDLITITINKQATAVAGGPASVCLGTTYSVTGASVLNASSFIWTTTGRGTLTNPTLINPTYTPHIDDITLGGGVVNLTLTATSAAPCTGNAVSVKVLTIINQPTAFAGSAAFTCPGSDYEIQSATATYASDYVWTSSSGGVFSNNHTIRPTYHVNSTDAAQGWVDITLSAIPISPCFTAATHTFRLTVLEGPSAYAGANQTICADVDYINTDATATDYTSLRWETSGTGTFSNDTLLHPTYSFGLADSINGYVTLTLHAYGSGSNGCNHDQSSVNITINKLPTANAGSMTEICVGSNPIIGASAGNNSGVLWTRVSGTGTLLVANSLQPIYNTSPGDIGTTVVLQLAALPLAPCTDTAYSTLSLFVRATPIVNAGPNDTICGIVPIVLSGATESNTTTRVWSSSGTGSFTDVNILNPSYTPSANDVSTGAVTLTITGYNGSCGGVSDYMILYISSPPQVSAGRDSSVCVNSTYTANGVITGSYSGILWSKTGAGTLLNTNSRTPTFIPDLGQVGQTITLTMKVASSAPCTDSVSSSVNLLVKAVPTALAGNDTTICENGTYKIIGAGATNYSNIFWTTSGDGIFSGGPPLSPTYIPGPNDIINGFAILTINSSNPPCLNVIDQMRLTFSYLPVVNAGNNATVDIGTSFTVSTATVSDSSPINWTSTGTGTFTGGTTLTPTYTPSATDFANGSVRLTLTATPSGICTTPVSDYMVLTVTDHPAVDFSWASSCAGTLTDFVIDTIVTDRPAIPYYSWDFGDGNTSLTPEPSHLFATAGTYRVTLTVTDTAGYTNIVWHNVEVNPIPVANFSYDQPSCSGLATQFTNQSVAPSGYIVEWMWDFDDGSAPITVIYPNDPNITHTYANSGTYNVSLTVKSSDSCVNAAILDVVITAAPIANFGVSNACFGSLTAFADSSTMVDNINIVAWAWDFGEPVSGNNNRSNVQNAVHQYLTTGTYQVRLIVTNANGCTDTITKPVIIAVPSPLDFDFSSACLNTQIQFTVDTVITNIANVTNWLWDFGDGITSTLRNPTHTYSVSGTYTVSLTALNINGCSNTITHEIIVFIAPVANFNYDNPTCSGDSVQFNDFSNTPFGTNITEWKWIFGDGDTITVIRPNNPNIQHRYDSVGTFTVTLIITNSNGCKSSVSRQITTLPSPTADFTYTPACMNALTQFNDASVPNGGGNVVSWRWNFGDPPSAVNNTSTQQNPVHQYNTSGTFTVILLIENTQGCTDTVSHQVSVTELPKVDFKITEACIGADVQFSIDSTITPINSIATYFWNFGDGITSNLQNPAHRYLTAGTYTASLTVTDINGCSNTVSHDLSLAALPKSLFGVSESQCNTDPIQFTNFSTTETGYITEWLWNFGDGTADTISFPNNPNLSHLYATNGTYTAALTVTNSNGCSNVSTQEIIILPGPIANFDFESVCLDVSARFTDLSQANGGGQIVRWNWDFRDPTSGVNNFSTLQNPSHLFKTVGNHVVLLTIYNEKGCMDTITKTINISMLPVIDFTTVGGSCLDKETSFLIDTNLVDLSNIRSVSWNFGDGLTSNSIQPIHIYRIAGTYNITLTITDMNGCTASVTKEVYIDQLPDVKFSTNAPSCLGTATQFNDLSSRENFIVEWRWEFGDGTVDTISWPDNQDVSHTYAASGTYQVKLTITTKDNINSSESCTNSFTKNVIILRKPIANFTATTVCIDHPAQFMDLSQENSGGIIVDWLWNFGDPASGINNSSSRRNPVHQYAVSGTYPVSLTITNAEGCTDTYSDSLIVTIPPPLDPFTFNSIICVNTEAKFRMSNNVNLADVQTILWDFGDPTSSDNNSSAQNPTHIYQTAGQYIVTLTLDNDNCGGSISDTIIVNSRPQARFEFTNACIGSPTVFTDLSLYSDSPIGKWKWDFGIINLLSDTSSIQNPVYTYRALGQHYVSLEITNTVGCSDKLDSVLIEIFPTPTAAFTFLESAQGTLSFTNKSLNADTYEWNFGDGWISNETNPIHVYDSTNSMISSTYENLELILISMNNVGCADTATKTYDLYFKGLYIPTAFSPNNPSESVRYFKPMGVNLETYKIEVYSTWNQLLWESSALDENGIPTESWDGTFRGSALPSGIYIWKANGMFKDGTLWKGNDLNNTGSGPTSGTLLLIR